MTWIYVWVVSWKVVELLVWSWFCVENTTKTLFSSLIWVCFKSLNKNLLNYAHPKTNKSNALNDIHPEDGFLIFFWKNILLQLNKFWFKFSREKLKFEILIDFVENKYSKFNSGSISAVQNLIARTSKHVHCQTHLIFFFQKANWNSSIFSVYLHV